MDLLELTWGELVEAEPRLASLLDEARAVHRARRKRYDPLARFFGYPGFGVGFKAQLSRLVGWDRPGNDPLLTSSAAYDVVYAAVLLALEGEAS